MRRLFFTGGALIILDQLSKKAFEGTRAFLNEIFAFKYHENTGAAFGILKDSTTALTVSSFIALCIIIYYYHDFSKKKQEDKIALSGLLLLFAGTAGNLIDRILLGYVRDFIVIWKWPAFNFADVFNCIGAALIIFFLLKHRKQPIKKSFNPFIKRFK